MLNAAERMSKFYITTTLPYVNAEPHIGFSLEIVQADAVARYHRFIGDDIFFNFGTDEHGLKIYRKAQTEGKDPQKYCDEYAAKFDSLKKTPIIIKVMSIKKNKHGLNLITKNPARK